MFDPNDVFVSLLGNERLTHLGINLELYSNFSFRDKLHINVVYNGEKDLTKNNLSYDSLTTLVENRGYYVGALDGINASLKDFIESDRNIGVIHNFDYLFFYDNPFRVLIDGFIKTNKGVLMWKMKNSVPPERSIFQTDCFVITKEFAKRLYPIIPKTDITIFYRKALAKESDGDMDVMEEWFFQRLVNILMYTELDEVNNPLHNQEMSKKYIATQHSMVMEKLHEYVSIITTETIDLMAQLKKDGSINLLNSSNSEGHDVVEPVVNKGAYDSKYHFIHTHHFEILRPLLIMFKYNLDNKKFKTIDSFINNEISLID
jgi:hypothetical protein